MRRSSRTGRGLERRASAASLAGMVLLASSACESEATSSDFVRTRRLYAELAAVTDGAEETTISVRLRLDGAQGELFEDFSEGDELFGEVGDESKRLEGSENVFTGTFGLTEDEQQIRIRFERTVDESATRSVAAMADAFEMNIEEGEELRRDTDVIRWSPAGRLGVMAWVVRGDCIQDANGRLNDVGVLPLDETVLKPSSSGVGQACDVSLTLSRIRRGDVDPAFERGGVFETIQRRQLTFRSLPSFDELGIDGGAPSMNDAGLDSDDGGTDLTDFTDGIGLPRPSNDEEDAGTNDNSDDDAGKMTLDAGEEDPQMDDEEADAGIDAGALDASSR